MVSLTGMSYQAGDIQYDIILMKVVGAYTFCDWSHNT